MSKPIKKFQSFNNQCLSHAATAQGRGVAIIGRRFDNRPFRPSRLVVKDLE
jgi:hypothetical protein